MNLSKIILVLIFTTVSLISVHAQRTDANIFGDVQSKGEHLPFVNIYIEGTHKGTTTDITGHYMLIDLPEGTHTIVAQSLGYTTEKKSITIHTGETKEINFVLEEETMTLKEVVVTGTRTFKRQTESPVIVNILESKSLEMVQASNISEGLRFQPGLRVETDCQTCNYTQLRINGLGGAYSQILINGRPVFSPLTGLYGMEQIPSNMVERIEVVRGGGSALYGSSAIGGTVNIITRIPKESSYDFSTYTQNINNGATDRVLTGNINMLTQKRNAGSAIFVSRRHREAYDHNGDNFSELPELRNNSFGANMFYKPTYNQKLKLSFSSLYEYRYGGEIINDPAYLARQSEERTHNIFIGGLDHQINFSEDNSSFITYLAGQHTNRKHYTGVLPDEQNDMLVHIAKPPYGYTRNTTLQAGTQFNHRFQNFPVGVNVVTLGAEYIFDDVFDTIPAYHYEVDQLTGNIGGYAQNDWQINSSLTFLTGLRVDKHNLVKKVIISPRISLLYKFKNYTQIRLTWGSGFRAPQTFDTDMHIAFAGGGVSRISLSPDLKEERSNSISGSINLDKANKIYVAGFTVEGFYTKLDNAFYLQPIGEDEFGEQFEKRNGTGATVKGITIELRGNYNQKIQLEAGMTLQKSLYDKPVDHIEGLEPKQEFLRTPNKHAYLTLSGTPDKHLNISLSGVYTGPMQLIHFAGAPEQTVDEYTISPPFTELNIKLGYTFTFESLDSGIEVFCGIKNITNDYQNDFDTGKNRDSNYIYSQGAPRTLYIGFKLKSL